MSKTVLNPYLIVNRTETNSQYFNLSMSKSLNYINVHKIQMFSKDELG
jgi:hypothetical protein